MKSSAIKQVVTPKSRTALTQLPYKAIPSVQAVNQQVKCVSLMTFSQKLYQAKKLEIAKKYEQPTDTNSLEQIQNLVDKLVEASEAISITQAANQQIKCVSLMTFSQKLYQV